MLMVATDDCEKQVVLKKKGALALNSASFAMRLRHRMIVWTP